MKSVSIKTSKNILENLGIKHHSLCICGSGKKYRDCCNIMQHPSYLTPIQEKKYEKLFGKSGKFLAAANDFLMEAISEKTCLGCKDIACHSHTIPKNKMANYFSNNHGFMYQITDEKFWENRQIGIGKATIFYGWCGKHDSELFQLTDNKEYGDNEKRLQECCLKLAGRGYRLKQNQLRNEYSLIKTHGINKDTRFKRQVYYKSYIMRREIYIVLYNKQKKGKQILKHYIFKIERKNAIFLSNTFYFNMDLDGNYIHSEFIESPYVFLNIFPEDTYTYIIFSIHRNPTSYIKKLFKEIENIYQKDKKLFKLIINNIILYYNFFSVITENKVIEVEGVKYRDFEEQMPDHTKYKLKDTNRIIFLI